jgi:hypothetical protein
MFLFLSKYSTLLTLIFAKCLYLGIVKEESKEGEYG